VQLKFEDRPGKPPPPKPYSVSQLVQLASRAVEARFGDVWVEGEVSNLKKPSSGHLYFTLKDARAQLAVVMFRAAASRLRFQLEDGQKLRCRGKLCIYDAQGRFQLTAEHAEPDGAGALQVAFEQLKRKLEGEGLFDPAKKKPLPRLPRRIAVVTSLTGAALRDILRVLHDRCPVHVTVCPTAVQGDEAPPEIVAALGRADRLGVDLIILGRGGGSQEDLWAFNHEGVARAIFSARTPVISAVGHEIDITIADLVADRRAPTPSAAAELAVPVARELAEQLRVCRGRLERAARQRVAERHLALERLRRRLPTPLALVGRGRMRLDDAGGRLEAGLRRRLERVRGELRRQRERLAAQEPRVRLARDRAALVALGGRLQAGMTRRLERGAAGLARAVARLEALSPLGVLARGYSLVLDAGGRVVREAAQLAVGDRLLLRLHRGQVVSRVEEIPDDPEA